MSLPRPPQSRCRLTARRIPDATICSGCRVSSGCDVRQPLVRREPGASCRAGQGGGGPVQRLAGRAGMCQEIKKLPVVTVSQGGRGLRTWTGSDWTGMPCSFLATRSALDQLFGSHLVDETDRRPPCRRPHPRGSQKRANTFPNADSSMRLLAVNITPHVRGDQKAGLPRLFFCGNVVMLMTAGEYGIRGNRSSAVFFGDHVRQNPREISHSTGRKHRPYALRDGEFASASSGAPHACHERRHRYSDAAISPHRRVPMRCARVAECPTDEPRQTRPRQRTNWPAHPS